MKSVIKVTCFECGKDAEPDTKMSNANWVVTKLGACKHCGGALRMVFCDPNEKENR